MPEKLVEVQCSICNSQIKVDPVSIAFSNSKVIVCKECFYDSTIGKRVRLEKLEADFRAKLKELGVKSDVYISFDCESIDDDILGF